MTDPKTPPQDADSSEFDRFLQEMEKAPPPSLPEMRMFVVTRYAPTDMAVERIYVTAHCLQYAGSVLMCQEYVLDKRLNRVIERTVRAFNSWVDVEGAPIAKQSVLTH